MWQQWIVAAVVAFASAYAIWYLMPASWRKKLARVQPALGESPGCSACSSCGSCSTPGQGSAKDTASSDARQAIWLKPSE